MLLLCQYVSVSLCVCVCVCASLFVEEGSQVIQVTKYRVIKSKMSPLDKKSPGTSVCLRLLGSKSSPLLLLVLFLLMFSTFSLSVCFLQTFSTPKVCH